MIPFSPFRSAAGCTLLAASLLAAALRANVDLDHDGVSDIWRTTFPSAGAPTADPDRDGADNLAESLAGTDPFDPASRLAATTPERSASGDTLLHWSGVADKRYRIDSSTDLVTWTLGSSLLTANESPAMVHPTGAASAARQFWRVAALDLNSDSDGYSDWEESQFGGNPAVAQIPLSGPFVPFALCMSNHNWSMSPAEQVALCQELGYTGLGISFYDDDPELLRQFADHPDVIAGRFRIHSMLWWYNPINPVDTAWLDRLLDQAKRMDMPLWVVSGVNRTAANLVLTVDRFTVIAAHCRAKGVQLVLYPHIGCAFENSEQGLEVRNRLADAGYPEVRLSIGLFHELRTGNADRLPAVIAAVKDYLVLATINGTDNEDFSLIAPLDRGTFDPSTYLQALADAGYTGPIELLTYDLPDPRGDDHLARSLRRWRQLVTPLTP